MMKRTIFTQGLVVVLFTMVSITVDAGQYDEFLHLVNHRNANGKLVWPKNPGPSEVQSQPNAPSMPSPESIQETPAKLKPVSHVQPTKPEVVEPLSQQSTHAETVPSVTDVATPVVDESSQQDHAVVASPLILSEDEPLQEAQGQDQSFNEHADEVVKKTVMPGQAKSYTFRRVNWGMSIPEVKTKETAEFSWELDSPILLAGEHRLGYHTQVNGVDAFLTYTFENDRLRSAKYLFETAYVENDAQPILDYKTIKAWLVKTYGSPRSEGKLWVNELYRYAPELWGRALMRGHLTMVDEWDVDGTTITLLLNGGDEEVGLMAEFMTKNLVLPRELVQAPRPATQMLSVQSRGKS